MKNSLFVFAVAVTIFVSTQSFGREGPEVNPPDAEIISIVQKAMAENSFRNPIRNADKSCRIRTHKNIFLYSNNIELSVSCDEGKYSSTIVVSFKEVVESRINKIAGNRNDKINAVIDLEEKAEKTLSAELTRFLNISGLQESGEEMKMIGTNSETDFVVGTERTFVRKVRLAPKSEFKVLN